MTLDWTISIGNIVSIVIIVASVLVAFYKVSARLGVVQFQVEQMWKIYERRAEGAKHD